MFCLKNQDLCVIQFWVAHINYWIFAVMEHSAGFKKKKNKQGKAGGLLEIVVQGFGFVLVWFLFSNL